MACHIATVRLGIGAMSRWGVVDYGMRKATGEREFVKTKVNAIFNNIHVKRVKNRGRRMTKYNI